MFLILYCSTHIFVYDWFVLFIIKVLILFVLIISKTVSLYVAYFLLLFSNYLTINDETLIYGLNSFNFLWCSIVNNRTKWYILDQLKRLPLAIPSLIVKLKPKYYWDFVLKLKLLLIHFNNLFQEHGSINCSSNSIQYIVSLQQYL